MPTVKEEAAAHKAMKEAAMAEVRKQRQKSLVPNKHGRPTLEEDRAALKEVLNPLSPRKQALKLFDQVVTANSDKVFNKLLQKAMDDEDRDQMGALKLIADRLAPITQFTESGASGSNNGKVVINISGLNQAATVEGRVIDAEDAEFNG
jgi:hypothetical protein